MNDEPYTIQEYDGIKVMSIIGPDGIEMSGGSREQIEKWLFQLIRAYRHGRESVKDQLLAAEAVICDLRIVRDELQAKLGERSGG